LYKEQGEERLSATYKRPWNRTQRDLEEKIVLLKEHEPGLTVRKAQENLQKEGIRISIKGIWGVWKRYGYVGFNKEKLSNDFLDCYSWTKEAEEKFKRAQELFNLGTSNKSAQILNSIPVLPRNELLHQIPDPLINVRRRVEKTASLYGKIPVRSYLEKVRSLYRECRKRNLHYSALKLGLAEIAAFSWRKEPMQMLKKIVELRNMFKKTGDSFSYSLFAPRFSLLLAEGISYAEIGEIKKALTIARRCRRLLRKRKNISPYFMGDLGLLYSILEDFREAEYWYLNALDRADMETNKQISTLLADIFYVTGKYKEAIHILKNGKLETWGNQSKEFLCYAMQSLINGIPDKAISLATDALSQLKKEEAKGNVFRAHLTIASAYRSLGETAKAKSTLRGVLSFFVKNNLKQHETITEILLSQIPENENPTLLNEDLLPTIKLALLLKNGQHHRALKYAENKGLLSNFHKCVFFFPEIIADMLEKGKPTGLPRAMLKLPVFRKEIPVYSVRFLGDLCLYKNQKYLRVQLTPKDTAFLIYLATSKSKRISLEKIYENFWPHSNKPSRNLAHLLVRIRKALTLPSHFLYIKGHALFFDCYFITDYGEYTQHLAQANAFERAGEWEFARSVYLQAFSLFRDAPFMKMYDSWSDDMRRVVLNQLENAAIDFAKFCSTHGDGRHAKRVLQQVSKIIPYSDEIKQLSGNLVIN
jgi:tetratricopeptide (TPR) repeat protein